ncbi:hypothetical protein HDU76_004862 [Blyttiomyces sp. JEL0837]|nr:hypothetical protein HDU76_004862 [Blyttiomyces sp. JEL0837]
MTPAPAPAPASLGRVLIILLLVALSLIDSVTASSKRVHIAPVKPPPNKLDLYGGSATWKPSSWFNFDDSNHGGKSEIDWELTEDEKSMKFKGHVDVDPKEKRGFASVVSVRANSSQYSGSSPWWDLSAWSGIEVRVKKGDGKRYSINLRNSAPSTNGKPAIDYKFVFKTTAGKPSVHVAPTWSSFVPTLRGDAIPADEAPLLDPSHIRSISVMCSSLLGSQSGGFEVVVESISAIKLSVPLGKHEEL